MMTTETDSRVAADKTIDSSSTAQYIAATVRAQTAWRGWDQRDIVNETGLRRTYVNDRWRGEREWAISDIEKISRALGMDAWTFFESARTFSSKHVAVRSPEAAVRDESEPVGPAALRARNQA